MIVVVVSVELGKLLHTFDDIKESPDENKYLPLIDWLRQHESKLVPMFPGVEDESLLTYFTVASHKEISNSDLAELRLIDGIDGSYRKPEDGLPG